MPWFARLVYRVLLWQGSRRQPAAAAARPDGHLEMGRRGERLAYWYLRRAGYVIVARNRRIGVTGELDLVAWDGPVLAFVEVKTRGSAVAGPPESALLGDQRRRIALAARVYLRRLPSRDTPYRFDTVSVLWRPKSGYEIRLTRDAFKDLFSRLPHQG